MKKVFIALVIIVLAAIVWKFSTVASRIPELHTYTNAKQGFEIGVLAKSVAKIGIDTEASKGANGDFTLGYFSGTFETPEIEVFIRKNANSEITPPYLPGLYPACRTEKIVNIHEIYRIPVLAFSSSGQEDEMKCADDIKDAHTVFTRFCVSSDNSVYPSEPSTGGSEGSYECKNVSDPEYDINIFCHGPNWQGILGRDKCVDFYSRIMESFNAH